MDPLLKPHRILALFITLILVITCGIAVKIYFFPNIEQRAQRNDNKLIARELEVLKSPQSSSAQKSLALRRLLRFQRQGIEKFAAEFISSHDSNLRAAAYEVIVKTHKDKIKYFKEFLNDTERSVRIHALGVSADLSEPEIRAVIAKHWQKDLFPEEKIFTARALLKLTSQPERREPLISAIFELTKHKDPIIRQKAIHELIEVDGIGGRATQILLNVADKRTDTALLPLAISHLSKIRNPWILENFDFFLSHPSNQIKSSALNSLAKACPPNRWKLLKSFISKHKDEHLITQAIMIPRLIGGNQATEFLQGIKSQVKLNERQTLQVDQELKKIRKHSPKSCSLKSPR